MGNSKKNSNNINTFKFVVKFLSFSAALWLYLVTPLAIAEIKMDKIAKKQWYEIKTEHFRVITDTKGKTAQALIRDLEYFRYFVTKVLNVQIIEGGPPLRILAIENKGTFKALDLPETWGGVFFKEMSGDFAIANIRNYSLKLNKNSWGQHVLLHEYVHYITRNLHHTSVYPLWYSEGEAEYLATFRIEDNESTVYVGSFSVVGNRLYDLRSPSGHAYRSVDSEDLFKTTKINMSWRSGDKDSSEKRRDKRQSAKFYARAMATYHYLKSTRELSAKTEEYLKLINQGKTVDYAFSKAFNFTWEELDDAVDKYISSRYIEWKYDLTQGDFKFPIVKSTISPLTKSEAINTIISFISHLSVYKLEEKLKLFEYADQHGEGSRELRQAQLDWYVKQNLDATDVVQKALKAYPDDSVINAYAIYIQQKELFNLFYVGHANAEKQIVEIRKQYRSILRKDPYNRVAYFGLGKLSRLTDNYSPQLLGEASEMLDSARLLMSEGWYQIILSQEITLNHLLNNPERLLNLKRQYATLSDNKWITSGYGRFVLEMLEMWALTQDMGELKNGVIYYKNGGEYRGEQKGNVPEGVGELVSEFGATLSGNFKQGKLEGIGTLKTSNGYIYTGEFTGGLVTGYGSLQYSDEELLIRQSGQFLLGQEHGKQHIQIGDSKTYEGVYYAGRKHGEFAVKNENGQELKRQYYFDYIQYKINENLIFASPVDIEILPEAEGLCYYTMEDTIKDCIYNEGKFKNKEDVKSDN